MFNVYDYQQRLADIDRQDCSDTTRIVNRTALRGMFTVQLVRQGHTEAEPQQIIADADAEYRADHPNTLL